jgi:hypothetical protein
VFATVFLGIFIEAAPFLLPGHWHQAQTGGNGERLHQEQRWTFAIRQPQVVHVIEADAAGAGYSYSSFHWGNPQWLS